MTRLRSGVSVTILAGLWAGWAQADAVVTTAVKAPSVAEIFIEERGVRVELEIGVSDIPAFLSLAGKL